MLVARNAANWISNAFSSRLQTASVSPDFSAIDALRREAAVSETWAYEEGDFKYVHSFHREPIPETDYYDIQSPYPYGGPVCNTNDDGFIERANGAFASWCQSNSIVVEFVRFHPMLENWRFFRGEIHDDRSTVWIDLDQENLLASYETRVRTAIRKAEKNNLVVEWGETDYGAHTFCEIYTRSMREIGAGPFYFFPRSYFESILRWPHAQLALCRAGERIVGGAIFVANDWLIEYHLSATDPEGKRLGANNLILHRAAQRGVEMGAHRLYLGGGTDGGAGNRLLFYKAGFSDRRASFKYGARIHLPVKYAELKTQFSREYSDRPNQILFYR